MTFDPNANGLIEVNTRPFMTNSKLLAPEWQALTEGLQAVMEQYRQSEGENSPDRLAAANRVEGFLAALRGLAASWADLTKGLPADSTISEDAPGRLPQWRFYKPLARALLSLGGRAKTKDAILEVARILEGQLQDGDREMLQTGQVRWMVNVRFARQELKERNLLNATVPGIWELSKAGKRWAESDVETIPAPVPPEIPGQGHLPF